MADRVPTSAPPPGSMPPGRSGGSGQYIAVAIVMLLLMGGLLLWKLKGTTPEAAPAPPPSNTVAKPMLTDTLPPPPLDDTTAPVQQPDAGVKPTTARSGCGAGCSGTASDALRSEVAGRAARARGCYERALRQNTGLQGKLTIALRVDPSGNVCSANATNDTVGSPEVSSCVVNMFKGQKLQAPSGGCLDMNIPINFVPKN